MFKNNIEIQEFETFNKFVNHTWGKGIIVELLEQKKFTGIKTYLVEDLQFFFHRLLIID